jgi:hypothetical protein
MMTKILISILFSLWIAGNGVAQVVFSSCEAPDSVKALYQDDADRLALKEILGAHLPFEDSIIIPKIYSDSVLLPLLAVYNATSIPERDTLVTIFKIHEFPEYALNEINIAADSTLPWMEVLRQGILPSGNQELDSILDLYNFQWEDYETFYDWFAWHFVTFKSASNYNVTALMEVLDKVMEVTFADRSVYSGDGDHIYLQREEFPFPSTLVTYFFGMGDCPSGCTDGRWWTFRVYDDCSVQFEGAHGSHIPFTATKEIVEEKISIQPNPINDFLEINGLNGSFMYSISDLSGRIVQTGKQNNNRIDNLDRLLPGIYFLSLTKGDNRFTFKIMKG